MVKGGHKSAFRFNKVRITEIYNDHRESAKKRAGRQGGGYSPKPPRAVT